VPQPKEQASIKDKAASEWSKNQLLKLEESLIAMEKQIGSTHPHVSPTMVNRLIHPITVLHSIVSECVDLLSPQSDLATCLQCALDQNLRVAVADSRRTVGNSASFTHLDVSVFVSVARLIAECYADMCSWARCT